MNTHNRIDDIRYNSARSIISLHKADGSSWVEYADLASLTDALATSGLSDTLLPVVGIYALALAAHEHSGWPTESRRAALIQAVQQVRDACPTNDALGQALDAALMLANDALMRGGADIEGMLVAFAEAQSG